MNHPDRYRSHEPRIRSSLDRAVGKTPTSEAEIRAIAATARERLGVIVFLPGDLERMPDVARMLIEGEHKRICERGGR